MISKVNIKFFRSFIKRIIKPVQKINPENYLLNGFIFIA